MLSKIHHVGVAVTDLDASIQLYRRAFGGELVHRTASDSAAAVLTRGTSKSRQTA